MENEISYFPRLALSSEHEEEEARGKKSFARIYKNWIRKALKTFSAVYSAHEKKNLWNCITCRLIRGEHQNDGWCEHDEKNLISSWFFVFVPCYHFFFIYSSPALARPGSKALGGWARWLLLNSVYQLFSLFWLWKFMWPAKMVDELYRTSPHMAQIKGRSANFQLIQLASRIAANSLWWQMEFKRRSSSCRCSRPLHRVMKFRVYVTAHRRMMEESKRIFFAVAQKNKRKKTGELKKCWLVSFQSGRRFIHHLQTWFLSPSSSMSSMFAVRLWGKAFFIWAS